MDMFQVVGAIYVFLTCCLGTALLFGLAGYGLYRLMERAEIGRKYEREAVSELLELAGERRSEIPGVQTP